MAFSSSHIPKMKKCIFFMERWHNRKCGETGNNASEGLYEATHFVVVCSTSWWWSSSVRCFFSAVIIVVRFSIGEEDSLSLSCCIEHTRDGGEEGQFVISSDCFHQSPLGCPRGILKAKFFPSSSEVLLSMMFTYDFYHFCWGRSTAKWMVIDESYLRSYNA